MKRAYVRPTMVGERFVANEYVAACGDIEHGNYKFECNAGKKISWCSKLSLQSKDKKRRSITRKVWSV